MSSQQKDHVNIQLDKQERSDLLLSVFKDNFRTIAFLAPVLLAAEIVLFILPDKLFSYSKVILPFIFCSMVLLPLVFLVRRMLHKLHPLIINSVQAVYALSVLLLGVFLSLESMGIVDFVHMFLMAMVAVATFLSFVAITRTVLFLSSYVIFALYLPQYQPDPDLRFVVLANVFIFGSLCWLLGSIVFKDKVKAYMNQQALVNKSQELKILAQKDAMTQLINHETSFIKLYEEIERAKRIGYPLSLIIIDIDDFKQVNDQYGHLVGDRVIKKVAKTILEQARKTDIVGRYGGEEFILILPDTNETAARCLVSRICQSINEAMDEFGFSITLSGGISEYQGEAVDAFIRKTDQKLYQAKNSGKNMFVSQLNLMLD